MTTYTLDAWVDNNTNDHKEVEFNTEYEATEWFKSVCTNYVEASLWGEGAISYNFKEIASYTSAVNNYFNHVGENK